MTKKEDEFYKKLKNELTDTTTFPTDYMYKFIIPNKTDLRKQLSGIFNHLGAVITTKNSKSNNFVSFTILLRVQSANEVILKYKEAAQVKGIISL